MKFGQAMYFGQSSTERTQELSGQRTVSVEGQVGIEGHSCSDCLQDLSQHV